MNIEGLACIGIAILAIIVYVMVTFASSIFIYDANDMMVAAYVTGCVLFVITVLLWATTECPFFVGVG